MGRHQVRHEIGDRSPIRFSLGNRESADLLQASHSSPARDWYSGVLRPERNPPHHFSLHNGEPAHTLMLGMTGSGTHGFHKALMYISYNQNPIVT